MCIEILKNSQNILIATLYRPPDTSNYLPRNFLDSLNETIGYTQKESKEMILLGDVNVNYLESNDNVRTKKSTINKWFNSICYKAN